MATRPVFKPSDKFPYVTEEIVEFKWHAGFSASQKQKSVQELHAKILESSLGTKPLEVSSKSALELGVSLSAFNLKVNFPSGNMIAVENIFQASKVFENGGPFKDLLQVSAIEAKRDKRLKESGELVQFKGNGISWPLEPKTLFYDWVYLNALHRNRDLVGAAQGFDCFTDIEFNPNKSFSCQARSLALYISLYKAGYIDLLLSNSDKFKSFFVISENGLDSVATQLSLI